MTKKENGMDVNALFDPQDGDLKIPVIETVWFKEDGCTDHAEFHIGRFSETAVEMIVATVAHNMIVAANEYREKAGGS